MKTFDGQKYITVGEVARRIGRVPQTVKYWLDWYNEQPEDFKARHPLPAPKTDFDTKGTRFFKEEDVPLFEDFKTNAIKYGTMADFSITRWGKRGQEMIRKREEQ